MQNRILQIMDNYGLNPGQFADKLGLQPANISHVLAGRNKPSLDFVTRILNVFPDINYKWLIFGNGPMLTAGTPLNEKKNQDTETKSGQDALNPQMDLFGQQTVKTKAESTEAKPEKKEPLRQNNYSTPHAVKTDSRNENTVHADKNSKHIEKIIVLYDDGTFEQR